MDKLERLLNLISALLETERPLTAEDLRARVPGYPDAKTAFRRAFERDKEDLREMGIPLVLETVAGVDPPLEGYRIDRERYYLRDPGFEPDELAALHLALTAVHLDGLDAGDGLWKLGGVDQPIGDDADGDGSFASLPGDPNLAALFQACADRRTAAFTYNDERRLVDPHGSATSAATGTCGASITSVTTSAASGSTASWAPSSSERRDRSRAPTARHRGCPTTRGVWARAPKRRPGCSSTPIRWCGPLTSWATPWSSTGPTARPSSTWP